MKRHVADTRLQAACHQCGGYKRGAACRSAAAALSVARAGSYDEALSGVILGIQRDLFVVAEDLMANPRAQDRLTPGVSRVTGDMLMHVDAMIDEGVAARPLRSVFIVPGANPMSAARDLVSAVVRRVE